MCLSVHPVHTDGGCLSLRRAQEGVREGGCVNIFELTFIR